MPETLREREYFAEREKGEGLWRVKRKEEKKRKGSGAVNFDGVRRAASLTSAFLMVAGACDGVR